MKVSISLPSLFPDDLAATLKSIRETTHGIEYEALVVSPFEVAGPDVRWIREDQPRGAAAAHNLAFRHATGDFVMAMTDDCVLRDGWAGFVMDHFQSREGGHRLFCLGLHRSTQIGRAHV